MSQKTNVEYSEVREFREKRVLFQYWWDWVFVWVWIYFWSQNDFYPVTNT